MESGAAPAAMVLTLPATPESVAAARHWLAGVLAGWSTSPSGIGDAELVFSELLTNAVRYGVGDLVCRLARLNGRHYCISVIDAGPELPRMRHPGPHEPAGRGLRIVDQVADSWGVSEFPSGKTVWAIIEI